MGDPKVDILLDGQKALRVTREELDGRAYPAELFDRREVCALTGERAISMSGDRKVADRLSAIPAEPGIYIMEGRSGEVLYVGKGRDLRSRVRSYFQDSRVFHPRIDSLISKVCDIRWIVTDSEVEALILESNLIKEYSPRYNVNLKDDKRYPYIKITLNEEYPRILVTRRLENDGARYFGPYTAVKKMRASLNLIKKIFPVRSCHFDLVDETPERVCLDYHIGKCLGPCHGHQSKEDYRRMIGEVVLFLAGKNRQIIQDLRAGMERCVQEMDFESAARYRDRIDSLKAVQERQKVFSIEPVDRDVVALSREGNEVCGLVMKIREGRLLGSRHLFLDNAGWQGDEEILSIFLAQFYQAEQDTGREILLPHRCQDLPLLEEWLAIGRRIVPKFRIPARGDRRRLVELAERNCRLLMVERKVKAKPGEEVSSPVRVDLRDHIGLAEVPRKIVCLDISEVQGSDAVGALVRFDDGKPRKSEYRRFRIRSVASQNDVAMMAEILERYLIRKAEDDDLPDLILLDGGKGQLSAGLRVLDRLSLQDIPIIALAKKREDLFLPGRSRPIRLPEDSPALHLLCRLRDEAHRFAVSYHRKVRSRRSRASALDTIPGIGQVRRRHLLRAFGSVYRIRDASVEELCRVEGFSESLSRRVKSYLKSGRS